MWAFFWKEKLFEWQVQNKELEMQVQQQKTKLAVSQNRELEFQRVSEMLEIERGKIDGGGGQDEANNIESHEKTIKDLELKLADLQASYDLSDSMVSDLTRKERASNDEIEEARKVAVMVMLLTQGYYFVASTNLVCWRLFWILC